MGKGAGLSGVRKADARIVKGIVRKHEGTAYTLWVDAFTIEAEKQDAEVTYKGFSGYHPLIGGLKEVPVVLREEFREGNEHPGARAVAFLEGCRRIWDGTDALWGLSCQCPLFCLRRTGV